MSTEATTEQQHIPASETEAGTKKKDMFQLKYPKNFEDMTPDLKNDIVKLFWERIQRLRKKQENKAISRKQEREIKQKMKEEKKKKQEKQVTDNAVLMMLRGVHSAKFAITRAYRYPEHLTEENREKVEKVETAVKTIDIDLAATIKEMETLLKGQQTKDVESVTAEQDEDGGSMDDSDDEEIER